MKKVLIGAFCFVAFSTTAFAGGMSVKQAKLLQLQNRNANIQNYEKKKIDPSNIQPEKVPYGDEIPVKKKIDPSDIQPIKVPYGDEIPVKKKYDPSDKQPIKQPQKEIPDRKLGSGGIGIQNGVNKQVPANKVKEYSSYSMK